MRLRKVDQQTFLTRYADPLFITVQAMILIAGAAAATVAMAHNRESAGIFDIALVVTIQLTLWLHRVMIRVLLVANTRLMQANEALMQRLSSSQN